MMEDDGLTGEMVRALREADPPPVVPREAMWTRIRAQREREAAATRSGAVARRSITDATQWVRRPGGSWLQRGILLAAMLVVGIGIGRMTTLRQPAATAPIVSSDATTSDAASDARTAPYRFAATQHLQRTEALLASLAADAGATPVDEVSAWARDLMTDTRLLLTSPAVADPAMKKLLEDLELVLAQISAIPAARAREEVELIQDGINHSDMMLRLRAATAGPRLAGT